MQWPATPFAQQSPTLGVGRTLQRLGASLHQNIPAACVLRSVRPCFLYIGDFLIKSCFSALYGAKRRTAMSACTL
ncbi:hypothetical protein HPB49_012219 [Dermacentor silvarum]|uniref:Uncharacterized protein n=1 Tax=Dermacentor silvarum TaxID=543639 RepID=A0ACB8C3V2_DERSI|nr:hypothetical protein HPB49_012219 [Dermacentor silvarum]